MTYDVTKYTDRLSALKFCPTRSHAVAAVADMLLEVCRNEAEADRLTAAALELWDDWPGPRSLRQLYHEKIAERRPQRDLESCELCRGTAGWRSVFTLIDRTPGRPEGKQVFRPDHNPQEFGFKLHAQYDKSRSHYVYDAVAPCSCASGRMRQEQLRKLDEQERRP